jgi:hypothetical protein
MVEHRALLVRFIVFFSVITVVAVISFYIRAGLIGIDSAKYKAQQLQVYLAKYPELNFNGVLQEHVKNISYHINAEYECKRDLEHVCERIRNREDLRSL